MIRREINSDPSVANPDMHLAGLQHEINPEAAYGDHIKDTAAICNTSASHTFGNVISVVEQYLLQDVFPADTFKTVTTSTTLANRQINHLPHQLHKKEMPIMVLIPRIQFGQEDNRFLGNTLMNSRVTNTHAFWGDGSLLPLAQDKHKKIWIHGHYNRMVMYIDVVLSFNTFSEQTNWMSYIHNMIPIGHNQFIRAPLELYIPEEYCELISNLVQIPIMNKDESVYDFLTYMNTIWNYPITYKLKGGSNSNEFFMYYLADIDTVIQEVQAGPGVKDGQIKRNFDITFTVRCDFNTIGYFTMNAPNIKKTVNIPTKENQTIVSMFSDVINLDDFHIPVGWIVLCWPIFKLAEGKNTISIDSVLNESLRTVIDYHLKTGMGMERFINIQFRENGQILTDEQFYIDWKDRVLHLAHPNQHRTYRLIITVSPEYINNLIKNIYGLE